MRPSPSCSSLRSRVLLPAAGRDQNPPGTGKTLAVATCQANPLPIYFRGTDAQCHVTQPKHAAATKPVNSLVRAVSTTK